MPEDQVDSVLNHFYAVGEASAITSVLRMCSLSRKAPRKMTLANSTSIILIMETNPARGKVSHVSVL